MKRKSNLQSSRIGILVGIVCLCFLSSCAEEADDGDALRDIMSFFPTVGKIDGGGFLTLTGDFSDTLNTPATHISVEVDLPYHRWSSDIIVTLDSIPVHDFTTNRSANTPWQSHRWEVSANPEKGIPAISETISAVDPVKISSPSWKSTVSSNANVTFSWSTTSDTTSHVILMVQRDLSPSDPPGEKDTSLIYRKIVKDNRSIVWSPNDFKALNIFPGSYVTVSVLRYISKVDTISGKSYGFINGFQSNVIFRFGGD